MKRTIAVLLITMLCACGVMTPPEYETSNKSMDNKSTNDKWVGHTVDELVVANGEPSNVYTLEGGNRVFEYLKLNKITTSIKPSSTKLSSSAIARRNGTKHKISTSDQSQDCKILFNISASDIIESWSTKGGECN